MKRYTEILKLKEMLKKANIPFTFTDDFFGAKKEGEVDSKKYPAYQIRLNKDIDVVQHCYSYGEEKNLLEIMGGLTEEERETDGVLGNLTAEEVFKRFKYCYENGTAVYKAEKPETKTEQEVLKMFDEFEDKLGIDRTPNYTVKIGGKYIKSIDYSKENGWMYETSDEPVWMSKINAECVITDVIEFIDSIPNENEVTFEVRK